MPDFPVDVWPLVAQHLKPRHVWKLLGVSRAANKSVDTEEYWARVALHMVMHTDKGMELDFPHCRRLPDPMKGVHGMRFVTGGYATAMQFFVNRVRQMLALPIEITNSDGMPVNYAGREQFALYADAPIADIVRMYDRYDAGPFPDQDKWVRMSGLEALRDKMAAELKERTGGKVMSMKQRVQLGYEHESSELRIDEDERKLRIRRACTGMLNRIEDESSVALSSKRVWLSKLAQNVYYRGKPTRCGYDIWPPDDVKISDWVEQMMTRFQPGAFCNRDYHADFWGTCSTHCKITTHEPITRVHCFLDDFQFIMHALEIPQNDLDTLNGIFYDTLSELRGMGRLDYEFRCMAELTY